MIAPPCDGVTLPSATGGGSSGESRKFLVALLVNQVIAAGILMAVLSSSTPFSFLRHCAGKEKYILRSIEARVRESRLTFIYKSYRMPKHF
jgi:hypothetical protein